MHLLAAASVKALLSRMSFGAPLRYKHDRDPSGHSNELDHVVIRGFGI